MRNAIQYIALGGIVLCSLAVSGEPQAAGSGSSRSGSNALRDRATHKVAQMSKSQSVKFSDDAKEELIEKFMGDAQGSNFYWLALSEDVSRIKEGGINRGNPEIGENDLQAFLGAGWGTLILKSEPDKAEVFLVEYGNNKEGRTTMRKKYPERTYTFELKKEGYNPKRIKVQIKEREVKEETVSLEAAK